MSDSEHDAASLPELTSLPPNSPLKLPPYSEGDTAPHPSSDDNPDALSSVKQIDNFVAPLTPPVEPESDPRIVNSAAAAAPAALDDDDAGPDDSSSVILTASLAPAPGAEEDADLEQQRVLLLQQLRDRAAATEASLQAERDRQHLAMLHALEQRKTARSEAASAPQDLATEGVADSICVNNDASQSHTDAVTDKQDASSAHDAASEKDRSSPIPAALPHQTTPRESRLHRSSSRSPSPASRKLRPLRPDIRVDIPSQHSQGESEAESMRGGLSDLWAQRLQSVNAGLHAQLIEMGFESKIAIVALEQTGSASLQEAIDFCLDHNNEDWAGLERMGGGDSDGSSSDISVGPVAFAFCLLL